MPRDSNGNYTLPAGNPVVTGSTIESTWANTTLTDVAQSLSDSLDRYGRGSMQAAFRFADGAAALPGIAWGLEVSTGLYRAGSGDMRATVSGADRMRWTADGVDVWDGEAWQPVTGGDGTGYLPLTGGTLTGDLTMSRSGGNPTTLYTRTDAAVDSKRWGVGSNATQFGIELRGDTTGARPALLFTRAGLALTQVDVGNATDRAPMVVQGEVRIPSSGGTEDVRIGCTSTVGSVTVTTGKELALKVGTQSRLRFTAAGQMLAGGATQNGSVWYHGDSALTGGKVTVSTSAAPATGTAGDIWLQVV